MAVRNPVVHREIFTDFQLIWSQSKVWEKYESASRKARRFVFLFGGGWKEFVRFVWGEVCPGVYDPSVGFIEIQPFFYKIVGCKNLQRHLVILEMALEALPGHRCARGDSCPDRSHSERGRNLRGRMWTKWHVAWLLPTEALKKRMKISHFIHMCLYLCHKYMMFHYFVRTVEVYVCLFQSCGFQLTFHEQLILEFPHGCHWGLLEISAFANAFDCTGDIPQQVEELREGLFVTKGPSSHGGRPSRALRHLKWRTTRRLPKWCLVISMKVEISYVFFNVFDSFDGKIQLYNIVTDPFVSCCMEPRCSEHSLVLDGTEFPSETQGLQNLLNLLKYLDWFQKFCTQQGPLIPRTRNVSHNSENFVCDHLN